MLNVNSRPLFSAIQFYRYIYTYILQKPALIIKIPKMSCEMKRFEKLSALFGDARKLSASEIFLFNLTLSATLVNKKDRPV